MLGSNDLFSGLGALAESRNLENDINSLNSFSLVATTIKNLKPRGRILRREEHPFSKADTGLPGQTVFCDN